MSEALPPLDTKEKLEILRLLLVENNKELVFWRERNWIALRDTVAGLVAIAGISQIRPDLNYVLVTVALTVAMFATLYLHKNFARYQQKLADGARIEEALSLYAPGAFLPSTSLLPVSYQSPKANPRGSYVFIATIWFIAAAISWGLLCPKWCPALHSNEPPSAAAEFKR